MIVQISKSRIIKIITLFTVTLILWLSIGFIVSQKVENSSEGEVLVTFKFLAPMKPKAVSDLVIKNLDTGTQVPFKYRWVTANTLQVNVYEQTYPRGHKYYYKFKSAPAMIWPFHVWSSGKIQSNVRLRFVGIEGKEAVPSKGPVVLQFNINVKPDEISKFIKGPVPGKLEPTKKSDNDIDYSRWLYWPARKLENLQHYSLEINQDLIAQNGSTMGNSVKVDFKTTSEFLIEQVYPRPGSDSIWLTREILVETNQKLSSGKLSINGLPGQCEIKNNQIKFIPERILMPGQIYQVKVHLVSTSSETIDYQYSFSTTNLGNSKWLELKTDQAPILWLVEGHKTIKQIPVKIKPGREIPKGTLYEIARQNEPNNISRTWIRLNADILIHSLPNNLVDNHGIIGLPKTYGCILISEDDLKLLSKKLPKGFMFISH